MTNWPERRTLFLAFANRFFEKPLETEHDPVCQLMFGVFYFKTKSNSRLTNHAYDLFVVSFRIGLILYSLSAVRSWDGWGIPYLTSLGHRDGQVVQN